MNARLLLLIAVSATGAVRADEAPAGLAGYHLKSRSSFDAADNVRPPFLPIGWVHHDKVQVQQQQVVQTKVVLNAQMFTVTSILLGHPTIAVINGRAYSEGESLRGPRLKSGDATKAAPPSARIRVQKIADGTVTLVSEDQSITVPMRRPELNEHKDDKSEELLLSGEQ